MKAWGVFLCATTAAAQTQWSAGFDSDVERLTDWNGDTAKYIVKSSALSLDAPSLSSRTYVYRTSGVQCAAEWRVDLRLDFNPSSANYAKVFLWSDAEHPDSAQNGLWLRIGGSAEDRISLFERAATVDRLVIESPAAFLDKDNNLVKIILRTDSNATAELEVDTGSTAAFVSLGLGTLSSTTKEPSYFIWSCIYTSTRSKAFHVDSISAIGSGCSDEAPPELLSVQAIDSFKVELFFDEEIEETGLEEPSNYALADADRTVSLALAKPDGRSVLLYLSEPLEYGSSDQLTCSNLSDISGNVALPQARSFSWGVPEPGALVINEIHADPEPVRGLPNSEYLEIFNPALKAQSTQSWSLTIGEGEIELPDLFLLPGEHAVLVAKDQSISWSTEVFEIETSEPFLPNSGTRIELRNPQGELIDLVEYIPDWHQTSDAKEGGISLERIDPKALCEQDGNWQSAPALPGGSPGAQNKAGISGLTNDQMRALLWKWSDMGELEIHFSKGLGLKNQALPVFEITPDPGSFDVRWNEMHSRAVLSFALPMLPEVKYTLECESDLMDCTGQTHSFEPLVFGLSERPQRGDVLVSELHFEPSEDQSEYVELWNISDKILDPADLRLVELDLIDLMPLEVHAPFGSEIWPPSSSLVFGIGHPRGSAKSSCRDESRFREYALPSLDNESGSFGLVDESLEYIDRVSYLDDFHFFRLEETRGVSLERVSTSPEAHTADHWASSRSNCDFVSPGVWNPYRKEAFAGVQLFAPNLSPNSDGYRDELIIHVALDAQLYELEWEVFGPDGNSIARIDQKRLSSGSDLMVWDGRMESGTLAPPGLYLLRVNARSSLESSKVWWFSFGLMP